LKDKWFSARAFEDIQNNSICVYLRGLDAIRTMKYSEDIEEDLVYVSNIPMINQSEDFIIEKEVMCRYMPIVVL